MSAKKKELKQLSDLPHYKEEFTAQLKEMGIENLPDLKQALSNEDEKQEIIDLLDGVGPKIADQWQELLESASQQAQQESVVEEEVEEEKAIVPAPAAKAQKVKKEETEIVEEAKEAEVVEEGGYVAKQKPELDAHTKDMLRKRQEANDRRPEFLRQEWFRYQRLGEKWRRPRGLHSKMRRHISYRPTVVSIGFRGPKDARGLHPSGFEEVMVHNAAELEGVDPKRQAVRVGGKVGFKKRLEIGSRADELGIRVLNRTG